MNKRTNGFTIVELLIVIVVIGILAAIVIVAYTGVQARAQVAKKESDISQMRNKFSIYSIDNNRYPATALELNDALDSALMQASYLPAVDEDSCGSNTHFTKKQYCVESFYDEDYDYTGYTIVYWNDVTRRWIKIDNSMIGQDSEDKISDTYGSGEHPVPPPPM